MSCEFIQPGLWIPGRIELIVIVIVAAILLGKKLPRIARHIGKIFFEVKSSVDDAKDTTNHLKKKTKIIQSKIIDETKDAVGLNDSNDKDNV